jgi:hypothetical protein
MFSPWTGIPRELGVCPECEQRKWDYIFKWYSVIVPSKISLYSDEQREMEMEQAMNKKLAEQEYKGAMVSEGGNIFTEDMLRACVNKSLLNLSRPPPRSVSDRLYRVSALDIGRLRDNTVQCTLEQDLRTTDIRFMNMEVMEAKKGLDFEMIKASTINYLRNFQPDSFVVDATGLGGPVTEDLARLVSADRSISTSFFSNKTNQLGFIFDVKSKKDVVDNLELAIKTRAVQLPPLHERGVRQLADELLDFSYDFTDSNHIVFTGIEGHDDRVTALALGLWGIKQKRFPRGMKIQCV